MAYLTCDNVTVGYAGRAVASGISFEVGPGCGLAIVGENGAGKSTLVKTLLGLIPPLSGELRFGDGCSAGQVGYLPQRGESQRDFPASAWEVALSGRLPRIGRRPFFGAADRAAAREALERVGASDLADSPFSSLSGGQQQRVLLARALCAAEKLLVLDEPTTGLDPQAAAALYEVLDALRADSMAVVAVTHDVSEALSHATHVLAFATGATPAFMPVGEWAARGGAGGAAPLQPPAPSPVQEGGSR